MKKKKFNVVKLLRQAVITLLALLFALFLTWFHETTVTPPAFPQGGTPLVYTNHNNDDLRELFRAAIDKAESSVLLIVYSLTDSTIIDALNQKSMEGVAVKVITDGKAVPFVQRNLNPKIDLLKRFGKGLMHLKILVVDHKLVWIGSANMTKESLRIHGNLVLGMENPALAAMIKEKANGICEEGPCSPVSHQTFPLEHDQQLQFWFLPDNRDGARSVIKMIDTAKKTIKVALFTWTRKDFAEAIAKASDRGVKVETVIDYTASQGAGAEIVQYLKKRGVPVRISQSDGLLHHKTMIIDDNILVNGSANWTKAAFTQNDDFFITLAPLTLEQQIKLKQMWEVILNESKPY